MDFAFTVLSTEGLIIFGAYFIGGMIDSICGGGGLIMVPSLMMTGMPAHMVIGTNQCAIIPGAAVSAGKFAKTGNTNWKIALVALPFALIGAFIGARLNLLLSEYYLKIVILVLLPVMAGVSLFKTDFGAEDRSEQLPKQKLYAMAAVTALVVGAYHAFYGPASGVFFLLGLTVLTKLDLVKSNGVSRFLLGCMSVVSSITYALSGCVCIKVAVLAAISYIVGNYLGASLAVTKGAKFIRPCYYCVLAALFAKLIFEFVA